jgi:hypothetical protein
MVTFTLSPLSGRENSSSLLDTLELLVTTVSPGLMSRRRVQRSSGNSTTREQVPCFGMNFDTINGSRLLEA